LALAESNSHFLLLLWLRWRLFLNSLRRPNRGVEIGFQVLWIFFVALVVVATSSGFFFGTMGLIKIERADLLDILLWAVLLVWQLAPVFFEGYSPGLNFREVARYPVSFRTYYLLSAAYGISDPAAITCLLWLFSIWMGVAVMRPGWALTAALALLLFAIFNLLLNRILIGLFDRFQSTRRGRERMILLMFVLILLPQLLQFATGYWTNVRILRPPAWLLPAITPLREFSPPGAALQMFALHRPEPWLFLVLLLYAVFTALLLRWQLRAIYQGEIYSEVYKARRELKVEKGWRFPLVDEITAAIMEKEIRYIRQSSRVLLQLLYPPIIFLLLAFNPAGRKMFFSRSPEAMLGGMAWFILLSVPNLAYNTFGMDKEGFGRWLLCPPSLRKIFLGKNLTHAGLLIGLFLFAEAIIIAVARPRVLPLAVVTVAFLAILVIQLGAGNLISVYWPKRIELTQMGSKMASNAAGLATMLVMLVLSALGGMIAYFTWALRLPWLPLVASTAILVASLKLYSYVLDRAARYTWEHIEEITGNLGA
jgi:ABC-2 type transport system permease protein